MGCLPIGFLVNYGDGLFKTVSPGCAEREAARSSCRCDDTLAHRVPVAKGLYRYEQLQLRTHKAQKFESVRPELLIGLAPGTMKAIAIKIITVVAFYQIVWYHAHMQISASYAVKRILALVPRSRVLGWLSQNPRKTAEGCRGAPPIHQRHKISFGVMSLADISLQTTAETARTRDTHPLLARW
jgi:hypothetical protein